MNKKDIEFLANFLSRADYIGITNKIALACDLSERLKARNPSFNKTLFIHNVKQNCSYSELRSYSRKKAGLEGIE